MFNRLHSGEAAMQIAIYGLGRMGANIARRLVKGGHQVFVGNRSPGPVQEVANDGATPSTSLADLVIKLSAPRVVWVMVPAGDVTEDLIKQLTQLLKPGDIII